jgi:hypothetical protein
MIMAIPGDEVTVGKQSKVQSKLQRALATSSNYRISREIEAMERVDGFVVGLGAKWVLIARRWTAATPTASSPFESATSPLSQGIGPSRPRSR